MKKLSLPLVVFLAACAAGLAAQQGPSPEMRARITGIARALTTFDPKAPETLDKLREDAFHADFKKRLSVDELRSMVARMRADFGPFQITETRRRTPENIVLMVDGETNDGRILVGVEPLPPHLITSIAVEIGGGEAAAPAAPEVNGRMTPAELSAAVDRFFAERAARDQFSGVVLIAKDGVPVVEKAYGFAVREARRPNTLSTRFNIGSINKAFTRTAIEQLIAKGKLAMTDTIGKILPGYPNKDARGATVDQLLNHMGGIADIYGPAFEAAPKATFRSNADYFNFVAPMPLTFPPGSSRRYCNGCYIVLGAIIEKVSGMRYEDYIARNIFEPAGMRTAGWFDASAADIAMGYIREGGTLRPNRDTRGARGSAAGGSYATAADLLAFDKAMRAGTLVDRKTMEGAGAQGGMSIGGGAPGLNAVLESAGEWTVVVLSNFDPPSAQQVGRALVPRLRR